MTLAVAEALNPNTPNQTIQLAFEISVSLKISVCVWGGGGGVNPSSLPPGRNPAKEINQGKMVLFADDAALSACVKSLDGVGSTLQKDLNRLENWCTMNKLTINTKKIKCMFLLLHIT